MSELFLFIFYSDIIIPSCSGFNERNDQQINESLRQSETSSPVLSEAIFEISDNDAENRSPNHDKNKSSKACMTDSFLMNENNVNPLHKEFQEYFFKYDLMYIIILF